MRMVFKKNYSFDGSYSCDSHRASILSVSAITEIVDLGPFNQFKMLFLVGHQHRSDQCQATDDPYLREQDRSLSAESVFH
jgi:hypothetical protein